MRWDDFRRSDNIEDRRDEGGLAAAAAACRSAPAASASAPIVVLGLIGWALGIDPRLLIGGAEMLTGGGAQTHQAPRDAPAAPRPARRATSRQVRRRHPRRHRGSLEGDLPAGTTSTYRPPRLVMFPASPTRPAAASRRPRWGRSTARATRRSISTPRSSARSSRASAAAAARPASSPRPM